MHFKICRTQHIFNFIIFAHKANVADYALQTGQIKRAGPPVEVPPNLQRSYRLHVHSVDKIMRKTSN